ncbi:MAG: DUF721 domain-containing protein [Planctomycetes bacterium]|nr:DUF721 domain-containing protein [Planctomycetota bacterium]
MHKQERKREPTPLQDALAAYLRDSGLESKFAQARVLRAWHEVVGEVLAKRARAVRFQGGELLVEVLSAPHLHELTNFTGERYRALANQKLGAPRITRVVFQLQR